MEDYSYDLEDLDIETGLPKRLMAHEEYGQYREYDIGVFPKRRPESGLHEGHVVITPDGCITVIPAWQMRLLWEMKKNPRYRRDSIDRRVEIVNNYGFRIAMDTNKADKFIAVCGSKDTIVYDSIWFPGKKEPKDSRFKITMKDIKDSSEFLSEKVIPARLKHRIPRGSVLDLGCGDGGFLSEVTDPKYRTTFNFLTVYRGVDLEQRRLRNAKNNLERLKSVIKRDGRRLGLRNVGLVSTARFSEPTDITQLDPEVEEFGDQKYSLIYLGNIVHWLSPEERAYVFRHADRMLVDGGIIVVTCNAPNKSSLFQQVYRDVHQRLRPFSRKNPLGYKNILFRRNIDPLAPIDMEDLRQELESEFPDGFIFGEITCTDHQFSTQEAVANAIEFNTREAYLKAVPHYTQEEKENLFRRMREEYLKKTSGFEPKFVQYTNHLVFQKLG